MRYLKIMTMTQIRLDKLRLFVYNIRHRVKV